MAKEHHYTLSLTWTGNTGQGTAQYKGYSRDHIISAEGKPDLSCSSDVSFRGDHSKYSPEDLLLASLSGCHMLWYLHLCTNVGIVVIEYHDTPTGKMLETADGGGYFTEVTLHPTVTVLNIEMVNEANLLHKEANKLCFIARSVNFAVHHIPTTSALNQ